MNVQQRRWLGRVAMGATILAAFAAGLAWRGGGDHSNKDMAAHEEAVTWTCSMHPQIQMPNLGQCPLCGMDLIPLVASDSGSEGPRSLQLSEAARAIAEVETSLVERKEVWTPLRMVGKLEADESRVREIASRVSGRIDKLYVDYTGVRVRRGQKLFDLYSPELYSAQEELVQAMSTTETVAQSGRESTRRSARRTIEAAREKLRLWGLSADQIAAIESRGTPTEHVTVSAPITGVVLHKSVMEGAYVKTGGHVYTIADLSTLWLKLDAYESDIALIEVGQEVRFTTESFPGEEFSGTVSFIDPVLDSRSRTIKVRVDVPNSDGKLRPGMFARARIEARIGDEGSSAPLVIPKSAALVTGIRAVVYVADPSESGRYRGREIVLGRTAGDYVVVREGLAEGERVVTRGAFKIDSALQILAKQSMMNPEGEAGSVGHQHHATTHGTASDDMATGLAGSGVSASGTAASGTVVSGTSASGTSANGAMTGESPGHQETSSTPIPDVPSEFRVQLEEVLARYFEVSTALSLDDLETAKSAAAGLDAALTRPDPSLLPPAGHEPWKQGKKELQALSAHISTASDLAAARDTFYGLSMAVTNVIQRFGTSGTSPVFVYHCPMARGGAGADWLQLREGTENPYYGSQMYRCGSQMAVLDDGAADSASDSHDHRGADR